MTLSASTAVVSLNANGTAHSFDFNFKIFAKADLEVVVRSTAGVETAQTLDSQYVIEDSSLNSDSGGSVKFKYDTTTAGGATSDARYSATNFRPANGTKVILRRKMALTQELDLIEGDSFSAEEIEKQLDKLAMQIQNMQEQIDRTIKLSKSNLLDNAGSQIGATYLDIEENTTARANKLVGFNSTGELSALETYNDLYLGASASAPTTSTTGAMYFDTSQNVIKVFNGSQFVNAASNVNSFAESYTYTVGTSVTNDAGSYNGSTTAFPAKYDVNTNNHFIQVFLNGIKIESDSFTANDGVSITLSSAASSGDTVQVVGFGASNILGGTFADTINVTSQGEIRLEDISGNEYASLRSPSQVDASYIVKLPKHTDHNKHSDMTLKLARSAPNTTAAGGGMYLQWGYSGEFTRTFPLDNDEPSSGTYASSNSDIVIPLRRSMPEDHLGSEGDWYYPGYSIGGYATLSSYQFMIYFWGVHNEDTSNAQSLNIVANTQGASYNASATYNVGIKSRLTNFPMSSTATNVHYADYSTSAAKFSYGNMPQTTTSNATVNNPEMHGWYIFQQTQESSNNFGFRGVGYGQITEADGSLTQIQHLFNGKTEIGFLKLVGSGGHQIEGNARVYQMQHKINPTSG